MAGKLFWREKQEHAPKPRDFAGESGCKREGSWLGSGERKLLGLSWAHPVLMPE